MSTFTKLTYHIVFGTKYRRPTITEAISPRLYKYIGGIIRSQHGCLVEIGGVEDHVHVLAHLSPTNSLSGMVREIKTNSSKWLNGLPEVESRFEWQKGYSAFTVSQSQVESVARYICNQKEHHRTKTFEEEYIEFLDRHGIEFVKEYMFEDEV